MWLLIWGKIIICAEKVLQAIKIKYELLREKINSYETSIRKGIVFEDEFKDPINKIEKYQDELEKMQGMLRRIEEAITPFKEQKPFASIVENCETLKKGLAEGHKYLSDLHKEFAPSENTISKPAQQTTTAQKKEETPQNHTWVKGTVPYKR